MNDMMTWGDANIYNHWLPNVTKLKHSDSVYYDYNGFNNNSGDK